MGYIPSALRTILEARLVRYTTMLTAAYDAVDASANGLHVQRYEIDTGEGDQSVWQMPPDQLDAHITRLEKKITHLNQRLNGVGVVNLTMKRKY